MSETRSFPCRRESVPEARRFAREVLVGESVQTRESVELMVSELATNCVRHAQSEFRLTIELGATEIRVEARDRGGGRPALRSPTPYEPTGRGLQVVQALSAAWGVEPRGAGKSVWFTVVAGLRDHDASRRAGRSAA
jgi:anti-sigma regulatory factor (Ser/Thr protein kinase)